MSLEHFKKQVLLLHSEQSTLDTLSSGFNDRYTVHCATSGSEALNTLGETQIDVIVSAQDLPGMSGLDALREAKKRSPDTVGILLAGNENNGLEALVGDQEVFQVVRGDVTPESLKRLIDGATRQARLLALAESANDTTANPDEPVSEHIVMETSENGATIISDGTGRLPVLDPKKVSAGADVGSRAVDVLVLTQDEEFLATVQESARGLHNVIYANTLAQADEAVSTSKIGVAVVDAAMVGNEVEKLTMHLRSQSPRLVAIVAGRRDDGEMLMDLINRGKVYRFLLKPVSPGRSRLAIEASVKHHLEAPDSAFKVVGNAAAPAKAAPKPQPKPQPKAPPKPALAARKVKPEAPKPAPAAKKATREAPRPVAPKPAPVAKAKAAPTATIVPNRDDALSPVDEGLNAAFGGDDSSFAETVTGLVSSVAKSFSSKNKTPVEPAIPAPAAPAPAAAVETPPPASSGGSLFTNPKILGIGAAALVAVAAVGFWLYGGSDQAVVSDEAQQSAPAITEVAPAFETETAVPVERSVDDLIDEAVLAASAGQVFNPPGSNAIELYMAALEVAPGDAAAEAGLRDVIAHALGMAETALLERRTDDVVAALERVSLADPDNSRLPFLQAQMEQVQLRNYLDDARAAIRDSRFEDATAALDRARLLTVADASEIDGVAAELNGALSEQRVEGVMAQANERLNEGKLIAPSNDNARFFYELALSNDPENAAARQGLTVIAGKLSLQAREQIDAGNFDIAEALMADIRRIDPSSSELAAAAGALTAARDRLAEDARRAAEQRAAAIRAAEQKAAAEKAAAEQKVAEEKAAAEQKAAADKAATEQKAAAEKAAAERQAAAEKASADQKAAAEKAAADKVAAERAAAARQAAEKLAVDQTPVKARSTQQTNTATNNVAASTTAIGDPVADEPVAQTPVAQEPVAQQPVAETQVAEARPEVVAPVQAAPRPQAPVAASTLSRTKYVAPKYPRAAQRRGVSGWVDVVFTVDIDGTVAEVLIQNSEPGETFVNAASSAVEDWEFDPVIENGVAVQKRAAVRMMFAIE